MICAMFLSMWISNTAATAMMVPIVDAIDKAINSDQNGNEADEHVTFYGDFYKFFYYKYEYDTVKP